MEEVKQENQEAVFEKIIGAIAWFLGSWWGVVLHTIIFTLWFVLGLDLEIILVAVSLEAIYIGIFLLMAANEEERKKEMQDKFTRQQDHKFMLTDIKLDEKAVITLREMAQNQKQILAQLEQLREKTSKNK